jgi:hypothetical protein
LRAATEAARGILSHPQHEIGGCGEGTEIEIPFEVDSDRLSNEFSFDISGAALRAAIPMSSGD